MFFSSHLFAKDNVSKDLAMKVTSIEIEHTNPSMGPYEKIKTISLSNTTPHEEQFNKFLSDAKIFNITFQDYLNAHISKDKKILDQISKGVASTDRNKLNEGATISNLTISIKDQPSVRLSDLRYYSFSGYYYDFISYLAKNGSAYTQSSKHELKDEPKPVNVDDEMRSKRYEKNFQKTKK